MDNSNTIGGTRDQTDEDILACTASDEALEAAAGPERRAVTYTVVVAGFPCTC
jgi:hypothetical protein